ncbi:Molybdopterin molybdenumtransferase [Roseovarius litorisediminis]|uniref:Molybdopterin molybdenumtransferase n=1 Tax=Roseovarius litorisediminis TaxID=1312363 RepID=A0A1Y5RER8_9RHOB|nr:gephyrin-like molybdotransferase Glp [Roseovarius litorisediminis]SLN14870.1 Molybdopterin molybdenumtransferase [Roseovarius litorisediminis]
MISVDDALQQLFSMVTPLNHETVPLAQASGRVLARTVTAKRDQPPFAASAMDGYAVNSDTVEPRARFDVVGEAAAGHRFDGSVTKGKAVRIFTGAPLPLGADRVIIQEDVERDGDRITVKDGLGDSVNIRPAGSDFRCGDEIAAPRLLRPSDIALLASMNIAEVSVFRQPDIALISTGDELVMPGETPGPDQIIASNTYGLKAMLDSIGAKARILPIARDTVASLETAFDLAKDADLIVTIGGASVGDHDLVGDVAVGLGMERAFYKIAMRPGKPLMAGHMNGAVMVGLPGNPVSAMVCGHVFLAPVVRAMLGLGRARTPRLTAPLANDLPPNGPREHYMRAHVADAGITAYERQDSALLNVLADANALLIRPRGDGPRQAGEIVEYLPI